MMARMARFTLLVMCLLGGLLASNVRPGAADTALSDYIQKHGDDPTRGPIIDEIVNLHFDEHLPLADITSGRMLKQLLEHDTQEDKLLGKMKARAAVLKRLKAKETVMITTPPASPRESKLPIDVDDL